MAKKTKEITSDNKKEIISDVVDEKKVKEEKKQYKEKSAFAKVMNIVLWVILFAWMTICITDYYRLTNKKDPIFCLKEEVTKYADGNVYSCLGLGYKTYKYERTSYNAIQFGPFWISDRSDEETE